jgi:hypothetical protein
VADSIPDLVAREPDDDESTVADQPDDDESAISDSVPELMARYNSDSDDDSSCEGGPSISFSFDNESDGDSLMPRGLNKQWDAGSTATTDLLSLCLGSTGSLAPTDDSSTSSKGA